MTETPTPPGAPIMQTPELTVLAEYKPVPRPKRKAAQSESELENELVKILVAQAYEPITVKSSDDLVANLRAQLEKLNDVRFTDDEWENFYSSEIANGSDGIREKTEKIQKEHIRQLHREDGSTKNILLIDKKDIHNNAVQVIRQFEQKEGTHENRYDVTILVNGLPLVQIELKKRGIKLEEAFHQIRRYQRESFWSGDGLFEYVQIFVISNGTLTKYYSNTTREGHLKERDQVAKGEPRVASKSFEFTSWWSDAQNHQIRDLVDFARTFLAKRTLLNILTRFCVFTCDKDLMVMRPYQIAATEAILNRIKVANQYRWEGSEKAGGYIWHTTGSGKTLTSFKTATLAADLPEIDKVLFVVDRKDLDYQTIKEYDKFEKGAASSNKSTAILARQLDDPDSRIIITTIQKLSNYVQRARKGDAARKKVADKKIVIIFDECHRSQFGTMHAAICDFFKKYFIFGFTGTPIFSKNAVKTGKHRSKQMTTEQLFGERMHVYTVLDAIRDRNVLGFKVDYHSTMRMKEDIRDEQVSDINREKALLAPKRIEAIVGYILKNFDRKTYRAEHYSIEKKRVCGFNSLFATASINAAKSYYAEFKKQQEDLPPEKRLKVAIIYSYNVNAAEPDEDGIIYDEDSDSAGGLDKADRDFLDDAIADYNEMFRTNYGTDGDRFANYYKDVSKRMKDRELDLLIVVDMFLTGFDAKTLNTLWVDKNLRYHGLLQAFSRTNRILNSVKQFGCIVCFRNLEEATRRSIALFCDRDAGGLVFWRTYEEYYNGYTDDEGKHVKGYRELVEELLGRFPFDALSRLGEKQKKEFVSLFGTLLRSINVLNVFDEFQEPGQKLISQYDLDDYQSVYLDIYRELRGTAGGESVDINDDLVFEIELIKQTQINIDFIIGLIDEYRAQNTENSELVVKIQKKIDSSPELRSKRDLILSFIARLDPGADVLAAWNTYFVACAEEELDRIIEEETLRPEQAKRFVREALQAGYVQTEGTDFAEILPAVSFFGQNKDQNKDRASLKNRIAEKLRMYIERFSGVIGEEE
jgi:type I restriction enzyme R subunit